MDSIKKPLVKWAQRSEFIVVTVEAPDCKELHTEVNEAANSLVFKGVSSGQRYELDLKLYKDVEKKASGINSKGRNVVFSIAKKDKVDTWWPRLQADAIKNPLIQIDWSKWMEEDDSDEDKPDPMANMDFDNMPDYPEDPDEATELFKPVERDDEGTWNEGNTQEDEKKVGQ